MSAESRERWRSTLRAITSGEMSEVLKTSRVVLVLFWAEWSMPDRLLDLELSGMAADFAGRLTLWSVDVDDSALSEVLVEFEVTATPTLLCFVDGKVFDRRIGGPLPSLRKEVEGWLAGKKIKRPWW